MGWRSENVRVVGGENALIGDGIKVIPLFCDFVIKVVEGYRRHDP